MGENGSVLEDPADSKTHAMNRGGGSEHPSPRPPICTTVCNSTYHNSVSMCIDPCFSIDKSIDIEEHLGILLALDGNVGSVVDGGVDLAVDGGVDSVVDGSVDSLVRWFDAGCMARGGKGALDMMKIGGKERSIEEVGGTVEAWTHRWSSGNGGSVGGFVESLQDKRKLMCRWSGGIDRACIGFDRSCYIDILCERSAVDTTTTTTTNTINDKPKSKRQPQRSSPALPARAIAVAQAPAQATAVIMAATTTTSTTNDDDNDDSKDMHIGNRGGVKANSPPRPRQRRFPGRPQKVPAPITKSR
jgi:hypothetical protein